MTALDEVVVVAMGIGAFKKSLTSSKQNIKAGQLLEGIQANMVNGMHGKISSVNISPPKFPQGPPTFILIRGQSTTKPLFHSANIYSGQQRPLNSKRNRLDLG